MSVEMTDLTEAMTELDYYIALRAGGAQLRVALMDQSEFWIPADAWPAFTQAARVEPDLHVFANDDVVGARKVAELDPSYRGAILEFLWKQTASICTWMAVVTSVHASHAASFSEAAGDDLESEAAAWQYRADDERIRRAWFDATPLIVALRAH